MQEHTALAILVSNFDSMSVKYLKHTARATCVKFGLNVCKIPQTYRSSNMCTHTALAILVSHLDAMSVKYLKHTVLTKLVSQFDAMSIKYLKHTTLTILVSQFDATSIKCRNTLL